MASLGPNELTDPRGLPCFNRNSEMTMIMKKMPGKTSSFARIFLTKEQLRGIITFFLLLTLKGANEYLSYQCYKMAKLVNDATLVIVWFFYLSTNGYSVQPDIFVFLCHTFAYLHVGVMNISYHFYAK